MTIIDEDGNGQTWLVKYWRRYSLYELEVTSLTEAFEFLSDGEDLEQLSSHSISGPNGSVLFSVDFAGDLNIHQALHTWERLRRMDTQYDQPEPARTPALPAGDPGVQ